MSDIIVLTDFSKGAFHAAEYALNQAAILKSGLHLLHVYERLPASVSEHTDASPNLLDSEMSALIERLKALPSGADISITSSIKYQELLEQLKSVYKEKEAALAVVGLTGSGLSKVLLGSTTMKIVTHSECNLLIIPANVRYKPVKKIVFATDLRGITENFPIEKFKKAISNFPGVIIQFVYVSQESDERPYWPIEKERLTALMELEGIPFSFFAITRKNTSEGVIEFVEQQQADILAIIPRLHGFWESLLRANHTKQLINQSPVPVLAIPEK